MLENDSKLYRKTVQETGVLPSPQPTPPPEAPWVWIWGIKGTPEICFGFEKLYSVC